MGFHQPWLITTPFTNLAKFSWCLSTRWVFGGCTRLAHELPCGASHEPGATQGQTVGNVAETMHDYHVQCPWDRCTILLDLYMFPSMCAWTTTWRGLALGVIPWSPHKHPMDLTLYSYHAVSPHCDLSTACGFPC